MYESFMRLKGKKVCTAGGEKYFGRLSDILVRKETNNIIGIVSKNDSLLYRYRFFPKEDISSLDALRVYVRGTGEKFVRVIPCDGEFHSVGNDIFKRRAVFEDGSDAGKIQNIDVDFDLKAVTGLEVGSSLAQDLLNGRKICRIRDKIEICRGNVVLKDTLYRERRRNLLFEQ